VSMPQVAQVADPALEVPSAPPHVLESAALQFAEAVRAPRTSVDATPKPMIQREADRRYIDMLPSPRGAAPARTLAEDMNFRPEPERSVICVTPSTEPGRRLAERRGSLDQRGRSDPALLHRKVHGLSLFQHGTRLRRHARVPNQLDLVPLGQRRI